MKTVAAFLLLACLVDFGVNGQDRSRGRCLCAGKGVNMVLIKNIEMVEIHPPSASCERREIIVTLKNGAGQKCLNPESKFIKNYILALEKQSQQ